MNGNKYFKNRTWEEVPLTKDNWTTYFEPTESFEPYYDDFGDFEGVVFYYGYSMKEEYLDSLDQTLSNMVLRLSYDEYKAACTVDSINEIVSIEKPGTFYRTLEETVSSEGDWGPRTIDYYEIRRDATSTRYVTNIQVDRIVGNLFFIND